MHKKYVLKLGNIVKKKISDWACIYQKLFSVCRYTVSYSLAGTNVALENKQGLVTSNSCVQICLASLRQIWAQVTCSGEK